MPRPRAALFLIPLLAGCSSLPTSLPDHSAPVDVAVEAETAAAPDVAEVVRQGRYTLVSTAPEVAQRDLLAQVVEVRIPPAFTATVEDALRHLLARSGYALCPADATVRVLYAQPLPAAHYQLGPLRLREALALLAGPAWQLQADPYYRRLCFTPSHGFGPREGPALGPQPADRAREVHP